MITESLKKQVQLLKLLGYLLPRGLTGLTDTIGCERFDSENHIYMIVPRITTKVDSRVTKLLKTCEKQKNQNEWNS